MADFKLIFCFLSLEMEEERVYNEMSSSLHNPSVVAGSLPPAGPSGAVAVAHRTRTLSSPVPASIVSPAGVTAAPSTSRPLSPGLNYGEQKSGFTPPTIGTRLHHVLTTPPGVVPSPSPPPPSSSCRRSLPGSSSNFVRPNHPLFSGALSSVASHRRQSEDERPPASPMDTSDNNASSAAGCTNPAARTSTPTPDMSNDSNTS